MPTVRRTTAQQGDAVMDQVAKIIVYGLLLFLGALMVGVGFGFILDPEENCMDVGRRRGIQVMYSEKWGCYGKVAGEWELLY